MGIVDLHAHVLPGVDDGPADADAATALLAVLAAEGVERVVATPHVSPRHPPAPAAAETALAALAVAPPPAVALGAEVHPALLATVLRDPHPYCLAGSDVLLVEAEPAIMAEVLEDAVEAVVHAGLRPMLAHLERSRALAPRHDRVATLVARGALVQVTAHAFAPGRAGTSAHAARRLLEAGLVHVVASDAHGTDRRRPHLAEADAALRASYGEQVCDGLLRENPALVLSGGMPTPPRPAARRRLLGIWRVGRR